MSGSESCRSRTWRHSHALRFSLLGVALFLGEARWDITADDGPRELTIGPARVEQLRQQWLASSGRPPNASEEAWLIRQWAEDEMLYREALELGLDQDDPGVCHRLALNMRFLGLDQDVPEPAKETLCQQARELGLHRGDPVIRRQMAQLMRLTLRDAPALLRQTPEAISPEDMRDYLSRHSERFSEPPRIRLSHVFLSDDRQGEALEESVLKESARLLLQRLVAEEISPRTTPEVARLGDNFLPGSPPGLSSQRDLERVFGRGFARAAMELPEGRWSGPVESGLGLHLVWVHERRPEQLRPLEEVEEKVFLAVRRERAEQGLARALERLRAKWHVRVKQSRVEGSRTT